MQLYLDLLKKILTNTIYQDPTFPAPAAEHGISGYRDDIREIGLDRPTVAHTMVGRKRLDNVHRAVETVLKDGVPGDFIETGVWRGGVCILIRAILQAYGVTDRTVWPADSFEGMPVTGVRPASADAADVGRLGGGRLSRRVRVGAPGERRLGRCGGGNPGGRPAQQT